MMSQYLDLGPTAGPYVELGTLRERDSVQSAGANALNGVDSKFVDEEEKDSGQQACKEG